MKISGVIEMPAGEPELERIAQEAANDSKVFHPEPEEALVGDLVLMLGAPILNWCERDALCNYTGALFDISQGLRWQRLRRRLSTRLHNESLRERRAVAIRFLAVTMARRLTEYAVHLEPCEGHAALEQLGEAYHDETKDLRDRSEPMADDHALLMAEFARRGYDYHFLTETLSVDLVDLCLAVRWDEDEYDARQLEIVHLPGDEEERLPGELYGVRGVTVKTREDQLREILPTELSPWFRGEKERWMVLDKIVNRSPLIFEHFTTTRPLSRHRVLVALIAGPERAWDYGSGLEAYSRARMAVFHLLFALALKVPRDQIQVDVGLFTRADGLWEGASFPLEAVPPRDEAWRNILELDEVQPLFFAHFSGQHSRRRHVEHFSSEPGDWISRTMARGVYRGVLIAAFGRAADRHDFLPASSIPLPRMDGETPLVLLGTGEDEEPDFEVENADEMKPVEQRAHRREALHRQASMLGGNAFPDLLSAHLAPMPLPRTTLPELSDKFLEMVIGPRRQREAIRTF